MSGVTNRLIEGARQAEAGEEEKLQKLISELRKQHEAAATGLVPRGKKREELLAAGAEVFDELERLLQGTALLRELTPRALDAISGIGERLSAPLVAAAITALEAAPYDVILPGHGLPGDRSIYAADRQYLAVAREAVAEATGPEDLNRRLEAAFPEYGGTAMQGLQNFYLFPGQRR